MRPEDIRSFALRPWADAERAKVEHWARLAREGGPSAAIAVADALREHVARFASAALVEGRDADWAHQVELKRRIDAASRRLPR